MTLVAGVDSSTQACKVVVREAATGALVRSGRAPHPPGTEVSPAAWERAFAEASAMAGGLDDVSALSVGGQQHGMVCLDASGAVVRDALLWNDVRSAAAGTPAGWLGPFLAAVEPRGMLDPPGSASDRVLTLRYTTPGGAHASLAQPLNPGVTTVALSAAGCPSGTTACGFRGTISALRGGSGMRFPPPPPPPPGPATAIHVRSGIGVALTGSEETAGTRVTAKKMRPSPARCAMTEPAARWP